MKLLIAALLLTAAVPARADDLSDFHAWVSSQSMQTGVSVGIKDRAKFATSVWDVVSVGQSGLNIFAAGALDYVDLGPAWGIANDRAPRYGLALPVHGGNIWDALTGHLPASVATHVHTVKLPDFSVSGIPLMPLSGRLGDWRWDRDFWIYFSYRYGGIAP